MNLSDLWSAIAAANELLITHPVRWVGVVLVFLVAVESLMLIPVVGFALKLAVAGVVGAKLVAMFAAASAGVAPNPLDLLSAFSIPASAQAALAIGALIPFAAGMAFLYLKGGPSAIEFFFSNILKAKPPSKELFVQAKYVMQLGALPFTFLAGAVVLKGLSGVSALSAAVAAAVANWLPLLLLGLLGLAFEWGAVQLPEIMPKWAAGAIVGTLIVVSIGWSFAFMYTASAKAFGVATVRNAG